METVTYYQTFEDKEQSFREAVHSLLPRKYSGPSIFWKDMGTIFSSGLGNLHDNSVAYISSNPRDSLAYSFVDDLLTATSLHLPANERHALLENVITTFSLNDLMKQEIHTLSGGEVVRLSLARAFLLSYISQQSIISSPFAWLSDKHYPLYRRVVDTFLEAGKEVKVLSMVGEDNKETPAVALDSTLQSNINISGLKIRLSDPLLDEQGQESWASVNDLNYDFTSPCLILGDNGSGKSLISRALSNSIETSGNAVVQTHGYIGHARLLFQDVITQAMLRPFPALISSLHGISEQEIIKVYDEIVNEFREYFTSKGLQVPLIGRRNASDKTLLEYKFMLVALRLSSKAPAIILDEPDWGVTKETASAFLASVVKVAHNRNIAVVLLSHKIWWRGVAKSCLMARKEPLHQRQLKYNFSLYEQKYEGGQQCTGN